MTKHIKRNLLILFVVFFGLFISLGVLTNRFVKGDAAAVNDLALADGAYIRVAEKEKSGIRFVAKINKAYYDGLKQDHQNATISAGMIIVPDDYVSEAEGYTFNDLAKLGKEIAYKEADSFLTEEDVYSFNATLVNILSHNYTRNFSAFAYIKATEEISGFSEYDGAWYKYAENENCKAKNIYSIAKAAYEDKAEYRTEVVKSYIDGVAEIENVNGNAYIANNTENYKSPYTIVESSYNNYILNAGAKDSLKGILYNGARKAVSYINDETDDTKINIMVNRNATIAEDGVSVSLASKHTYTYAAADIATMGNKGGNDYVAFKGDYGLDTYVSMTYKGNNMPTVCFFANEINADMTNPSGNTTGNTGLIAISGMYADAGGTYNPASSSLGLLKFYGPNRIDENFNSSLANCYYWGDQFKSETDSGSIPLLTQQGMTVIGDPNATYKYTVGVEEEDGTLAFRLKLDKLADGAFVNLYNVTRKLAGKDVKQGSGRGAAVTKDAISSGNIIIYAQSKESGNNEFSVSAPFTKLEIKSKGATVGNDGSVSMKNKAANGIKATNAGQWASYHNYYAYAGNYGVGTYIDFEFTGYNMPQLILFADGKEGDSAYQSITNYGTGLGKDNNVQQERKGVVILNGLQASRDYIHIFGPNRMNGSDEYGKAGGLLMISKDEENGKYKELTRAGQIESSEKDYALTVGTFVGTDGKVWIDMLLKDGTNGTEICRLQRSLGITSEEAGSGDIIILPPFGTDGEYIVDNSTTCKLKYVGEPYKSSPQNF